MDTPFACSHCHTILLPSIFAAEEAGAAVVCPDCDSVFPNYGGAVDATLRQGSERAHYDELYDAKSAFNTASLQVAELREIWEDPQFPEGQRFLSHVDDFTGKTILLLGNGLSSKELYFLELGAKVIFSDLSIEAVLAARTRFVREDVAGRAAFHAIDAYNLPLADGSVDIVYGWAFVHHMEDLDSFFTEVNRVLKPGGKCYFLDNAYSRVWQLAKYTVLYPLMKWSHRKWGISPEDLRATAKGGFTEDEVREMMTRYGFSGMEFDRFGFSYRIFKRGLLKLTGNSPALARFRGRAVPALFRLDEFLASKFSIYERNTVNVVWIFEK